MNKYFKLLLCAAFGLGAFTACEDVPAPYNIPSDTPTPVTPTADFILNQTFTSSLGEFTSQSESGNLAWTSSSKYGAIITGYDDWDGTGTKSNKPGVTLLVSPIINLTECDSAYVIIDQAINYAKTTLNEDHALLIIDAEKLASYFGLLSSLGQSLPMSFDGLGTSFTYVSQNVQIPQEYIGKSVQIALKHIAHDSYSSTWEVKSLSVAKGQAPANSSDTPVEGLVGSGTKDDPYDVPSTIKLIAAGPPSTKIYTKGKISKIDEIDTGSFGNATYYISNDGTTTDQLEVYRGYGLGGAKFTSTDDLKVGDDVIVYGQVVYFNNKTMEFTQGSELYMHNGEYASDPTPSGDPKGTGSKEDPYNIVAAASASGNAWVQAYIVGWIEGQKIAEGAQFNGTSTVASNLLIADTPDETDVNKCMPVQLPAGDVRSALNLVDNPGNYKKQVKLYGSIEKYFGVAGLKSVSEYEIDGSTPPPPPTPGEAKGSGTLEDPYNSVAANNIAKALASGAQSDQAYYIKGKVVSIKEQFGAQYGNVTCYISDDGTTANQFYVFRAYYLGNRKWVAGDQQLAVGDEIVVYAKLTNYQGNTPETVQGKEGQDHGYIYSINSGDTPGPGPQPGGGTKTLADFTNGDFESWTGDQPDGWKSASSASNATLSQSTDAHGGSYSVKVGGATSANKRLAYEELELEAGTYTMTFYCKAAASGGSVRPGYVPIKEDGSVGSYVYGDYVNDLGAEWVKVEHTFELAEKTTICLVVMNSKNPGADVLIDDFTIVKK